MKADLSKLIGPIVALSDCMSTQPKEHLVAFAARFNCVKVFFSKRKPAFPDAPFCTDTSASVLGMYVKLCEPSMPKLSIYLVFNAIYTFTGTDRKAEIQDLRAIVPSSVREKLTCNTTKERLFFAKVGFEAILDSWARHRPSDTVYICNYLDCKDRTRDKFLDSYYQFGYGLSLAGITPVMLHGRMF